MENEFAISNANLLGAWLCFTIPWMKVGERVEMGSIEDD